MPPPCSPTMTAPVKWEPYGTVEFDARRVVTLDGNGDEIEETACGKG